MKQIQVKGVTYDLSLTVGAVKRVKSVTGFDLSRPDSEVDGVDTATAVMYGVIEFSDILAALIPSFNADLEPEELTPIRNVFIEEWVNFFRRLGLGELANLLSQSWKELTQAVSIGNTGEPSTGLPDKLESSQMS